VAAAYGGDGRCKDNAGRNGHEYKVPELPQFSVDGYVPRLEQYTSSLDVIFTVTRINRSVTSIPPMAIH